MGRTEEILAGADKWISLIDRPGAYLAEAGAAGSSFRKLLWDKLEPAIKGAVKVIIIPDGGLAQVPWAALPGTKEGTFLVEEMAISILPDIQALSASFASKAAKPGRLVLVGGVDYDNREGQDAEKPKIGQSRPAAANWKFLHSPPLSPPPHENAFL